MTGLGPAPALTLDPLNIAANIGEQRHLERVLPPSRMPVGRLNQDPNSRDERRATDSSFCGVERSSHF